MAGSKPVSDRCRGLKRDPTARVVMRGHALMQNIRRGHYELGVDARTSAHRDRVHRARPDDLNAKRDGDSVPRGPGRLNATAPVVAWVSLVREANQAR
jgi:hypothetical protein